MTPEQFERLVKEHSPSIDRYCKRYCIREWQDLKQEALVKAWESRDEYNPDSRFSSWVIQIAKNISIDWHRKQGRRPETMNMELGTDGMAIDLASWQDCGRLDLERVVESASPRIQAIILKTVEGESLTHSDRSIMYKWRKREGSRR